MARAKAGERDALDELFRRFYGPVEQQVHRALSSDVRHGRPWLGSRFSTADIVQETFHGVLRDMSAFGGTTESSFAGYLAMVVRNRIIDIIRFHQADRRDGRRIERRPALGEDPASAAGPFEEASQADQHEVYMRVLKTLSESEQLLLRARFEDLATFEELTESLGFSSVSATRRAFANAKARLAERLERGHGNGASGR